MHTEEAQLQPSFSLLVRFKLRLNTSAFADSFPVAILDAGRNSMSFFMLLVVSLGKSLLHVFFGRHLHFV
jgi:hypothetical protein